MLPLVLTIMTNWNVSGQLPYYTHMHMYIIHVLYVYTCIYMYIHTYVYMYIHAVKTRLEVAAAFMILGVIATFVSLILFFPFFHWGLFVAGAIISFISSELLASHGNTTMLLLALCLSALLPCRLVLLHVYTVHVHIHCTHVYM